MTAWKDKQYSQVGRWSAIGLVNFLRNVSITNSNSITGSNPVLTTILFEYQVW